jgi:hypothetical protein
VIAGEEKALIVDKYMNMLPPSIREFLTLEALPFIVKQLQAGLPDKMKEDMREKGLICDVLIQSEEEQATYFYSTIKMLTEASSSRKNSKSH